MAILPMPANIRPITIPGFAGKLADAIEQIRELKLARPYWQWRGGPGLDYPCVHPTRTKCALYECQELGRCKDKKWSDDK